MSPYPLGELPGPRVPLAPNGGWLFDELEWPVLEPPPEESPEDELAAGAGVYVDAAGATERADEEAGAGRTLTLTEAPDGAAG